ncbi:MAG: DUF1549 domain-containing protein, partial [Planctomycetaceae bacterium]|nr:DUF1549 domain-containing protein [Planctomycetaceae bacterium]
MGLDTVELVIRTEEAFEAPIPGGIRNGLPEGNRTIAARTRTQLPSSGLRPPSPRVRGEGLGWSGSSFGPSCLGGYSLLLLVLCARIAVAGDAPEPADAPAALDRAAMVARVDALLAEGYRQHDVTPAPAADDAEFLRRVSLDLAGVIPSIAEVREFNADPSTDKRARRIERLLTSPSYARHLARSWRDILLEQDDDSENLAGRQSF